MLAISATLIIASIILCLALCIRRIYRNHKKNKALVEKYHFESALNSALIADLANIKNTDFDVNNKPIFNEVLLRYFRTLNGERADALRTIIELLDFEPQIRRSTKVDTIGRRMEAMQVLSFLNTQASLLSIYEGLSSSKKYIRLTAARCLTRRQADVFLDDIIISINEAFPDDPNILADILFRFGSPIAGRLETYISSDFDDGIQAACLEALVLIMPANVSLDLDALMDSPDERIRSATVSLSTVTSHTSTSDILLIALADPSTKVKIKSAKLAHAAKRADMIALLFKLTQDPILWVRYWSTKAIWNTGRQGRKLIDTIAKGDDAAGHMAREVKLECTSSISAFERS